MLGITRIIVGLMDAYTWIIIIYCLLTWIPSSARMIAEVKRILSMIVEPFLKPFQKLIPPIGGMVDITPIVAVLVLQLARALIIGLFY